MGEGIFGIEVTRLSMSSGSRRGPAEGCGWASSGPTPSSGPRVEPRERGLEPDGHQQVRLQPGVHARVQEGARPGGDRAVVGVVGQRPHRPEGVHLADVGVGRRLIGQVAEDRRAGTDVPEGLAGRAGCGTGPHALADPGAPPGEAALLAERPWLVDLHLSVDALDRGHAKVVRPLFRVCCSIPSPIGPGRGTVPGGTPGRLPRRRRAGPLGRSG